MKKKIIVALLLVLPILVNCQTQEHMQKSNLGVEPVPFDTKTRPDVRGIISYDRYQVVVANGNETVLDIAERLDLDPRKFSLFNGLVESYRPRQGELLALNKKIDPKTFLKSLEMINPSMSFAGVESTMLSPAETSHQLLKKEQRNEQGIVDNLIRFSVGIEDPEDLIEDISLAIHKCKK